MTESTKNIAKEIRTAIKAIKGVKLSVTTDHNVINVNVVSAPFALVNETIERGSSTFGTDSSRPYNGEYSVSKRIAEDRNLTPAGLEVFKVIDAVIQRHHWDKSDVQSDYFNCAFYYHYYVGNYAREFTLAA